MTLAVSDKSGDKGRLFVVSGPSGAGKGTLVAAALEAFPDLALSISATTRSPRPKDVEGETYYFINNERFDELIRDGGFLEWAEVHGFRYGTLVDEVNKALDAGKDLILEIDLQGYQQIKNHLIEVFSIFIVPPSLEELEKRLELRGTENRQSIESRLATARVELEAKDSYNAVIVNDDLDVAEREMIEVIGKQRNGHIADDKRCAE